MAEFYSNKNTLSILSKVIPISPKKEIYSVLHFEWNNTEMSQDFQLQWPYNFGFHHQITQGYTNKGQWLGSGIGYGGNSQYLDYVIYYPKGKTKIYFTRNNPDNNYIYSKAVNAGANKDDLEKNILLLGRQILCLVLKLYIL